MWVTMCPGRLFISYYPLKQGLKHDTIAIAYKDADGFISYYPLKQGLKLGSI